MTDEELMNYAQHWLDTPEIQRLPNSSVISFIADVCRHWRTEKKISKKQRGWVITFLNKHTWRDQ